MAKTNPENCTTCDWFDRIWNLCTNPDSKNCGERVYMTDGCNQWVKKAPKEEFQTTYLMKPVKTNETEIVDGECKKCGWFGDCVAAKDYNFCPGCGRKVRRDEGR